MSSSPDVPPMHLVSPYTPISSVYGSKHPFDVQANASLTSLCFKIFVVIAIVIAAVTVIVGILALMVAKGGIPGGMGSINKLAVIGEVNSYVMICAGCGLFIIGILAWSCHLSKENQKSHAVRQLMFSEN